MLVFNWPKILCLLLVSSSILALPKVSMGEGGHSYYPISAQREIPPANDFSWQRGPQDARRAIKNNTAPPLRKVPKTTLPPLPVSEEGIVRNVTIASGKKLIALTFDLCELDTVTTGCDMELLAYLYHEHIPATLFMGGKWMRTHAERAKQLMRVPFFSIGNHAWSHGNAALLSDKGLRAQVNWMQAQYELLREEVLTQAQKNGEPLPAIAAVPTLYRLPYGRSSQSALQTIASLGLIVMQWDVVAEGGAIATEAQAKKAAARLLPSIHPGSVLLFHANAVPKGTALLVQALVPALREKGYSFCTAEDLLRAGTPNRVRDGYFSHPKDNYGLDRRFGVDGTGRKQAFVGE